MIYVTNGNESEPLVYLSSFEWQQQVKGDFSISFNSVNDEKNIGHSILLEESVVTVDDYDFRVKQMKETRHGKQVTALSTYFDLIDTRRNDIYGGTRTFNEFLNYLFKDTGWRTSTDFNESRFIENFGENNIVALTNALCQVFECEFEIRKNNLIHFSKKIGGDYDAQYRYRHNVQALSKNVDTTKLKTYIEGYGHIDEVNGGQVFVSYLSPNADKFGKREADPVRDDRYTNPNELLDHLKSVLTDEPEMTFEMDSIELLDKELGERVWLIYEPLDIELQTRILSQSKGFVNGQLRTTKVTLGNTLPKTTTDILISQKVEIDENKKITRSKFEQTNDRISMAVETIGESIAELELTDKEIRAEVKDNKDNISKLTVKAEGIEANVSDNKKNIANLTIRADRVESNVSGLDSRMGQAESSIVQTNNRITLETRGDNLISNINVAPGNVSINAEKINLNGAVMVDGTITGNSTLEVQTDATVGRNLNIGRSFDSAYSINFGGSAGASRIYSTTDEISLEAMSGVRVTGDLNVRGSIMSNGDWVLTTNGYSYSLEYDPRGMLWFKQNGSNLGFVKLDR